MRSRKQVGVLALMLAMSATAHADMMEIKGKGFVNGTVLSQDEKEVRFEDSKKNILVIPKKDVLFLDTHKDVIPPPKSAGEKLSDSAKVAWNKAKKATKGAREGAEKMTRQALDTINAPLDRSAADQKGEMLAASMDDLAKSLGKMSVNDKKRQKNQRMMLEYNESKAKEGEKKFSHL